MTRENYTPPNERVRIKIPIPESSPYVKAVFATAQVGGYTEFGLSHINAQVTSLYGSQLIPSRKLASMDFQFRFTYPKEIHMSDATPTANNKLVIARRIARFVAVRSVSGVVVTAVHQNVTVEGKFAKVQLYVGTFLLGSMVADKVWDHTEQQIDEIVEAVQEARKAQKENDNPSPLITDL